MTISYRIRHHQVIEELLSNFNSSFLQENMILFGGGTRIALELDEFRESVDIDFFCPNSKSYRAARQQITNVSLGNLVYSDFKYARDIRADRDAIRCIIEYDDETDVKLEIVAFSDYQLSQGEDVFDVPSIDRVSCFFTKLLANADRYRDYPYKDILDICAMYHSWGSIPDKAIELAEDKYGERTVIPSLKLALNSMLTKKDDYLEAADDVSLGNLWKEIILNQIPEKLLKELR